MSHLGFTVHIADRHQGGTAITVIGELDMASAPRLDAALDQAIGSDGEVALDMRACSFVDSSGIATIAKGARRLHDDGRVLKVEGAQTRVRGIFELAGLLSEGWIAFSPGHSEADEGKGSG